jgi:hypothetical protein
MFVVTHSPFIIHIENRRNDKVIVLARDGDPYDISSDILLVFRLLHQNTVDDVFESCELETPPASGAPAD